MNQPQRSRRATNWPPNSASNNQRGREMRAVSIIVPVAAVLAGFVSLSASAAELKLLAAGATRAPVQELAPEFEKASGHKVKLEFATAGKVEEKVVADDEYDVIIVTKPRMDKLVKTAKVVGGTVAPIAKAQIGLAVKKGAPKPDISSVDALKKTLLGAKAIAYIDPASGGT